MESGAKVLGSLLAPMADGAKWYDAPDDLGRTKPLCRTDDSSGSGDGGIFTITSSNGVWDDCPSECAAIGGTFTCIADEAQNIVALAAFRGHCPGGADDCGAWIAVSDEASEGNWVCTADGSPQTYQPWSAIGTNPTAARRELREYVGPELGKKRRRVERLRLYRCSHAVHLQGRGRRRGRHLYYYDRYELPE